MAQDYYFNSHNPNNQNNNVDNSAGQTPANKSGMGAPQNNGKKPAASGQKKTVAKRPASGNRKPPKKAKAEDKPKRSFKVRFLKFLLATVIVGGVTGVVVGITMLIYAVNFVNGDVVFDLDTEKYAQAQATKIVVDKEDGTTEEIAEIKGSENRIWVDLENMSEHIPDAFIAMEDKRFEKHKGVDWFRTISAVVKYGGSQGGSTITQQLIKNLTDQKSVTLVRKFNEILSALNIEKHNSKEDIVEAYLNVVYLSHSCYGVKTASMEYFGKDVKDLNIAESAVIAAITQWPNKYDPLNKPEENRERQIRVLNAMLETGKITQEEYNEAVDYKLVFTNSPEYEGAGAKEEEKKSVVQSYYIDYIVENVTADLVNAGYTKSKATRMVNGGGLVIHAAIDQQVQAILENVYVNREKFYNKKVQSAMAIMEYDGRVAGIIGGAGEKTTHRGLNRAVKSKRQPGSTIKPLGVYAPALELGATYWSQLVKDSPSRKSAEEPNLPGNKWPTNQGEVSSGANVTVQYALAKSYNTVPVRILNEIGFNESMSFLTNKARLTTLVTDKSSEKSDIGYSPLALGGMTYGTTVLEMTAAYQMFGNGGYYCKPYSYYKVEDARGETLLEIDSEKSRERVLSAANATVMNKMLQTVAQSGGTGASYALDKKYQMIAKTGTTTGSNDRWFVAGTPYYVAAVWYGYDTPAEIKYTASSNPCGSIWNLVMGRIHSEKNLKAAEFETSSDAVQRKYCTSTGLLAGKNCGSTANGWYDAKNLPATCKGNHGSSGGNRTNSNDEEKPTQKPSATKAPDEKTTAPIETPTEKPTEKPTEPPVEPATEAGGEQQANE